MSMPAQPPRQAPRSQSMVDFYLTAMRTTMQAQFQYRAATYMYLIGMVAEPVIYLVVWTTIADSHGGSVQGITAGEFAAYYIVWTLVRNMNIVFTPHVLGTPHPGGPLWPATYFGRCTSDPLRPGDFAGGKFVWVLLYFRSPSASDAVFNPTCMYPPSSSWCSSSRSGART